MRRVIQSAYGIDCVSAAVPGEVLVGVSSLIPFSAVNIMLAEDSRLLEL